MEDLGINVAEKVGMKEAIGKSKEIVSFNAVAVVRAHEDGKLEVLGVHFMNADRSMVTVRPGEVRKVELKIEGPK
jgi:hypothetical protein